MALTDNLVAYWKLDEPSGNATDSSGNGYTLTNTGTITYGTGKINNGAINNAGSKRLGTTIAGLTDTSNNSWSFWYKATTNAGYMIDHGPSSGSKRMIVYNDGNGMRLFASGNEVDGGTMNTGQFYHIVITKSGSNWGMYVNGTSVGTTTSGTASYTANSGFSLLSPYDSFGAQANGTIDEVGLWNRVLSGSEITSLYNSGNGLQYPFGSTSNIKSINGLTYSSVKSWNGLAKASIKNINGLA